jgi:hypothetical protein
MKKNDGGVFSDNRENGIEGSYLMVSTYGFYNYLCQKWSKSGIYHAYFYTVLLSIFCCID